MFWKMSRKYIRYFVRMKNRRVFQGPEVNKIFWMRLTAVTQIRPVSRLNMPLTFSVIGAIELCWFKRLGPVIIQRTSCETLLLWWKSSGKYFGYGTFGANYRRTVAEMPFRNIDWHNKEILKYRNIMKYRNIDWHIYDHSLGILKRFVRIL